MNSAVSRERKNRWVWLALAVSAIAGLALLYVVVSSGWYPFVSVHLADGDITPSGSEPYELGTTRRSYWALDDQGNVRLRDGKPYRGEKIYHFRRTIDPGRTAVVVMDPWVDMCSDHLNSYHRKIMQEKVVPLVVRAVERGHPVIVLTNHPSMKSTTNIHEDLAAMVHNDSIGLMYHQGLDARDFARFLRSHGIDSLIYVGFSSNSCVIGRPAGMIRMKEQGFTNYFVPEASAATEFQESWSDQSIHNASTLIISQWLGELIDWDEFMADGE